MIITMYQADLHTNFEFSVICKFIQMACSNTKMHTLNDNLHFFNYYSNGLNHFIEPVIMQLAVLPLTNVP